MARFGKIPVKISEGVSVEIVKDAVIVSGPKGKARRRIPQEVKIVQGKGELLVEQIRRGKAGASAQGSMRAHLKNMIVGVTEGWNKELEIVGAGYRAELKDRKLILTIGYSHPVEVAIPEGVEVAIEKNIIKLSGADKEVVGQLAADIRSKRKPEPYKGSGIKYATEEIRRKAGKQAAKIGAV